MVLDPDDRCALEERVRAHTIPQRAARRAHIVLLTAGGCPAWRAAEIVREDVSTVVRWRDRYAGEGLAGLEDRPRSCRPPVYGPEVRLRIVEAAWADDRGGRGGDGGRPAGVLRHRRSNCRVGAPSSQTTSNAELSVSRGVGSLSASAAGRRRRKERRRVRLGWGRRFR
ncbi:helix-turn-helix domain-containing protein [Streptomyces sp. CA-210063]|uniref:helix-turn-helix domain-containing protein n=1 Tax=Streptomyces sp. CA-210063 TaxID=2801029 RepID=UPI00214C0239|nr:helix-turn-helix domain-containing protein [Streptomyces sp. CA-210063]UUU33167.1 helix-turn-helix domain-containing protein [Streptomyces sp. CA-210063]